MIAADLMRAIRQRGHVVHVGRLIMHMGEHDDADRVVEGVEQLVGLDETQIVRRQTLQHVEVVREIAGFGEDRPARRHELAGGCDGLEQIDGRRIRHGDFARRGADQAGDLVADAQRRVDPPMQVPALDEVAAPLIADDMVERGRRRVR